MPRLMIAGAIWNGSAYTGGRVVRLETDGSWTVVFTSTQGAGSGCHHLKEFQQSGQPVLFFIDSNSGSAEIPDRGQLFRSKDEGDTWVDVSPPPVGDPEFVTSFSLGAAGRIWCITDERENMVTLTGGPSRIYFTDDSGDSWTLSFTIPEFFLAAPNSRFYPLFNVAADPNDSQTILVEGARMVALDTRMWLTTDGGTTWSAAFDPTFPVGVASPGSTFAHQLDYASDGSVIYMTRAAAASATHYIFRSTDDGATWSTFFSETLSANDGVFFLEGCDGNALYFVSEQRVWKAANFADTPATLADDTTSPFAVQQSFMSIDCSDGDTLDLGTFAATPNLGSPVGVYQRPTSLVTGWVAHPDWGSLSPEVWPWVWGVLGATTVVLPPDRFELPCEDPAAAGDVNPQCIPIINWKLSIDGQHGYYTRARTHGMGMQNAGQGFASQLPDEGVWNPDVGSIGDEGGSFNVRREIIITDYGINESEELTNLADAYLPLPTKTFKGITTIEFQVGGIPRARFGSPTPNKILQAGDRIQFSCGSVACAGIVGGAWVIDEVSYEFPKGITTVLASKRPAAHARPFVIGNIRTIGESLAAVGGVFESKWFSTTDDDFLIDPDRADPSAFYDTFAFEHFLGTLPRTITMVAAKQKIFDWYDRDVVEAAQPLYVPRQFIDLSQVQGVGYNIIRSDEFRIVFHFLRYLFYDDLDGEWILPQNRFLKIWIMP